jgi:hypothetical protein
MRHVLVPGEDQVHVQLSQKLQNVPRVEDDVPLAARAGDRDKVVVHHENLEPVSGVLEAAPDKAVMLASHPPVVQVRLGGVDSDHDRFFKLDDRVALPEEPLEVDVADVPGVVVAGDHHDVLAPEAAHILGRLLKLLAVASIREISRDHDRRRLVVVDLEYRAFQKVRDEVHATAVDVADLANR